MLGVEFNAFEISTKTKWSELYSDMLNPSQYMFPLLLALIQTQWHQQARLVYIAFPQQALIWFIDFEWTTKQDGCHKLKIYVITSCMIVWILKDNYLVIKPWN